MAALLHEPLERISPEMVFRGLYHYTVARAKGDPRTASHYLAAPDNRDLGVLKRRRKHPAKPLTNSMAA